MDGGIRARSPAAARPPPNAIAAGRGRCSTLGVRVVFQKHKRGLCTWTAYPPKRRPVSAGGGGSTGRNPLPHDLAQLVVERELGLPFGFWGAVAAGATFRTLVAGGRKRTRPGVEVIRAHVDEIDEAEHLFHRHVVSGCVERTPLPGTPSTRSSVSGNPSPSTSRSNSSSRNRGRHRRSHVGGTAPGRGRDLPVMATDRADERLLGRIRHICFALEGGRRRNVARTSARSSRTPPFRPLQRSPLAGASALSGVGSPHHGDRTWFALPLDGAVEWSEVAELLHSASQQWRPAAGEDRRRALPRQRTFLDAGVAARMVSARWRRGGRAPLAGRRHPNGRGGSSS